MELAEGNARVAELTRLADTATAEREKAESEHVAVVAASVAEPKARFYPCTVSLFNPKQIPIHMSHLAV